MLKNLFSRRSTSNNGGHPDLKKRNFVADGVFFADINELLNRELVEDGYSGVEGRMTRIRRSTLLACSCTLLSRK
jgi:hypothetical protein